MINPKVKKVLVFDCICIDATHIYNFIVGWLSEPDAKHVYIDMNQYLLQSEIEICNWLHFKNLGAYKDRILKLDVQKSREFLIKVRNQLKNCLQLQEL